MTEPVYTCRQFRLLIAGSRHANAEMLRTACQAVARAKANGWMVLVGDNPKGVDAAVIDACDRMGVNVIVFGVAERQRKGSYRPGSYWRVDTPFESDDDYVPASAYTARDRYMIDLADRCFFIHDGLSRGTKAGYDYAVGLAKPADIRVSAVNNQSKPKISPGRPASASARASRTVELVIDVNECGDVHTFEGTFGLRALDLKGKTVCATQQTLHIEVSTSDGARMQTIIAALTHLTLRLKTETAPYRLRIYQTSKNVDGWLGHRWKRNAPDVQRLAAQIDTLLQAFPDIEWIKEPSAQVCSRLSKIPKGGDAQP